MAERFEGRRPDLDKLIREKQAEAWSEGYQDGWSDRAHIGEDATRNPYRTKETE